VKTNFANRHNQAGSVPVTKLRGFTVIELMIVLVITSILLTIAVPAFNKTIRDNRVLTGTSNLASGIAFAKSEAVRRSRMVTLCPSTNSTSCDTAATFDKGWAVMVELPTTAKLGAPSADTSVGTAGVLMGGQAIQNATASKTVGTNNWIRFSARGLADEAVTLQVKPSTCATGTAFQEISVGLAGRVSITKKTC
jgi:type IV fimbrial biogenesis protein FimT